MKIPLLWRTGLWAVALLIFAFATAANRRSRRSAATASTAAPGGMALESPTAAPGVSFEWTALPKDIDVVKKESHSAAVIVAVTAEFEAVSGVLFRKVLNDPQVRSFLAHRNVDAYEANATFERSVGAEILRRHRRQPPCLGIWRSDGSVEFRTPPLSPEGVVKTLQGLISPADNAGAPR